MALLTFLLLLFFIQPLSVYEGTPCATYNHTVELTLIGAPSFHQGYALEPAAGVRRLSANLGDLQGRAARSLLDTTEECFYLFLNRFYQFIITTPQMHLVNSQSENASERALHFTEKKPFTVSAHRNFLQDG